MPALQPIPSETPIAPSGLKILGVTNRRELNIVEAENIRKAVVKYLAASPSERTAPFDFGWCVRLHKEMFGDVWEWAGVPRTRDGCSIGVPFHTIRGALYELLQDLKSWTGFGMELTEQAARLHYRAVKIHPFENGNGRWARMLANIWLKLHGSPITDWPEKTIGESSEIRDEYISAIRRADEGDYEALIELHRRYT